MIGKERSSQGFVGEMRLALDMLNLNCLGAGEEIGKVGLEIRKTWAQPETLTLEEQGHVCLLHCLS